MKKSLIKYILVSCLCAVVITVTILSAVSYAATRQLENHYSEPDYLKYLAQGYDFESISTKRNIIFCITDGEDLVRAHLICIDENKHTLDILDIPPSSYITCDGFSGTVGEAYKTSVFKNIIGRMLLLDIHAYAYISADGFISACEMIGSDADISTLLDHEAYLRGDSKAVKAYYSIWADLFKSLGDLGAVEASAKLIGILINEIKTDYTADQMIELVTVASKLKMSKTNIHLIPGCDHSLDGKTVYAPNAEKLSLLLNKYFRVAGYTAEAKDLGITDLSDNEILFKDLSKKITDY